MQGSFVMCGRFASTASPEELVRKFGVTIRQNLCPRWNVAPNQQALVIMCKDKQNAAAMAQWGIRPAAFRQSFLINARSETVQEKPAFQEAFQYRRCIVAASGWYEWSAPKKPWYIQPYNGGVMAFGGLLFGEADQQRFVILTTAANAGLADIHHRAPLVLSPDNYDVWIGGDAATAAGFLRSASANWFNWYRVGSDIGKVSHDYSALTMPLSDHELRMEKTLQDDLFA